MSRRTNKGDQVALRKQKRGNLGSTRGRLGWQVSRGRHDLMVAQKLTDDIAGVKRREGWNARTVRLAEQYADSLVSGNGSEPSDLNRKAAHYVRVRFAAHCLSMDIPASTLPGQNQDWYDSYLKTAKTRR